MTSLQTREQMLAGLTTQTVAAQRFGLDEKALEAAHNATGWMSNHNRSGTERAISAYLSALPSSPVSELVDLRECLDRFVEAFPAAAGYPLIKRGYASLTTLSTRNAELEREVKRLREVMQPFSVLAGEMFARGWDSSNVAIGFDGPARPVHATAGDFFAVRTALSTSPQGGEHGE